MKLENPEREAESRKFGENRAILLIFEDKQKQSVFNNRVFNRAAFLESSVISSIADAMHQKAS